MSPNIKAFRVHRALAWFYLVLGAIMYAVIALTTGRMFDVSILPMSLAFLGVFAVHYFTGRACKAGKTGGRIASFILSGLMLLAFPIGTLIGVYLLYNTWASWPQPQEV